MSDGSIGNIAYFANGDRALSKERIEVFGGGRAAVIDDFRALEMCRDGKSKVVRKVTQEKGIDQELLAFLGAVRSGTPMPIAWRSILLTTVTTLRIVDAVASGQPEAVI
jgi:polar amino acid transport system substrate-binding protein